MPELCGNLGKIINYRNQFNNYSCNFFPIFEPIPLFSNMKKLLLPLSVFCYFAVSAQTPTFSEQVAPIMYAKCDYCHNPGGIAPFSLVTYQDAYAQRFSIAGEIGDRIMPPWPPDPKYSHFLFERTLTPQELKTITDWATGDAPEGDKSKLPPLPGFAPKSPLHNVELNVRIPKYTVNSDEDVYRCFAIPANDSVQHFISGMEITPGNSKCVHHVLVFYDTTGECQKLDDQDPAPGYNGFGGVGSNSAQLIGAWVPGSSPIIYPKGMGSRLAKNAVIVLQVHYAGGNRGESDSTTLSIQYSREPNMREVFLAPVLNHFTTMVNGPLYIPANTVKTFTERYRVPVDVSVLSVAPHMHLIGHSIKVYAVEPAKDTIPLVKIDNWDFHWQGYYAYPKLLHIKTGTTLYANATYDNTANNIDNPNNPPKDVSVGEKTTDEMMLVYFAYMYYRPGDENIVLDTSQTQTGIKESVSGSQVMIFPNPARQEFHIRMNFSQPQTISAALYDIDGRKVETLAESYKAFGMCDVGCHTNSIAPGNYIIRIITADEVITRKINISE
jgi:hypothetical protein